MKNGLIFDFNHLPKVDSLYQEYINSNKKPAFDKLWIFSKLIHAWVNTPIDTAASNKNKEIDLLIISKWKKELLDLIEQVSQQKSPEVENVKLYAAEMLGLLKNRELIIEEYLKKQAIHPPRIKGAPFFSHHTGFPYLLGAAASFFIFYKYRQGFNNKPLSQDYKIVARQTAQPNTPTPKSNFWFFIFQIALTGALGVYFGAVDRSSGLVISGSNRSSRFLNQLLDQRKKLLKFAADSQSEFFDPELKSLGNNVSLGL